MAQGKQIKITKVVSGNSIEYEVKRLLLPNKRRIFDISLVPSVLPQYELQAIGYLYTLINGAHDIKIVGRSIGTLFVNGADVAPLLCEKWCHEPYTK